MANGVGTHMEEIRIINGQKVLYKPAGSSEKLSESVLCYLSAMLPKGRLAIESQVWDFLANLYGVHHIDFEEDSWDKLKNIDISLKLNKRYKFISDKGRVNKVDREALSKEGFEFEPATEHMVKVKDYKKYLFDFSKETDIDVEFIKRINKLGYASLNELIEK